MRVTQMDPFSGNRAMPRQSEERPAPPMLKTREAPFGGIMKNIDIKNFKKDDWILLGIIAALVLEGSRDYMLLCSLGYLFVMGFK